MLMPNKEELMRKSMSIVFSRQLTNLQTQRNLLRKKLNELNISDTNTRKILRKLRSLSYEHKNVTNQFAKFSQISKKTRNSFIDPEIQKQMAKGAKYNTCLKKAQSACFPSFLYRQADTVYKRKDGKVHPNIGPSRSCFNNIARSKLNKHKKHRRTETTPRNVAVNIKNCIKFTCLPPCF